MSQVGRYGVLEQGSGQSQTDLLEEQVRLLGYAALEAGLTDEELDRVSELFDAAEVDYMKRAERAGHNLAAMNEGDTIRMLPVHQPAFWDIVFNAPLHALLKRLLGPYYILNQANGLINRSGGSEYHQSNYHRDLPYQHFTTSRPLAINALFAVDDFTLENGATRVIPASHHREAFPPDALVRQIETQVPVKRGTFIVLDCLVYHAGSTNRTQADRRAINHVFTIPMFRQQFHLPSMLGAGDMFDAEQKKVLGYGLSEFSSVEAWFASRN